MPQANQPQAFLSRKRAGVLVPVFSIYSKKSFGVGDLADLKLVIDWCRDTGNSILQLLPMNDMGGLFCPYDALSAFALEPLYVSLLDLALPKDKSLKRQIEALRKSLKVDKKYVDYSVKNEKLRILREIFLLDAEADPESFVSFRRDNAYWLPDYALFKALKLEYRESPWYDWPLESRNRDKIALEDFRKTKAQEIRFQEWAQWQLFEQFKAVKGYAKEKKVSINGDLPILVSRDSSDVWAHPEFFKLEFAAGAPPDMYAASGQRWGMPTYNWGRIADDGYKYLQEKLKYADNFYDILRVDHVVGLFRIWSIPYNDAPENQGLNGSFDPANEAGWGEHGRKILEVMLKSAKMFLCAEDLGVIPKVCPETLRQLNILGNDVQRWAKDWDITHDFLKADDYRQLAVTMLSTHDTANWPAWWENETGTVDEGLFLRKCAEAGIDFERAKLELFDAACSKHGRLRWKDGIDSVDRLIKGLSPQGTVPRERLGILIGLYVNTYREKEKLWKQLELKGPMRERCDKEIFQAILKFNLAANSLFCINTLVDLLYLDDLWQADAYQYRINTPGTISGHNWSLKLPLSLEDLHKHPVTKQIRKLVIDSGRV
ncbi:MAG: 4-alpha-glucanotransferase [Candidatus Omnitrophota bacterium]